MKKILIISLLLVNTSFAETNTADAKAFNPVKVFQKQPIFKVVSASEFKALLGKKGIQLIDVRTAQEFSNGHIANAKNLDFYGSSFKTQLAKLDKSKPVLIYCHSGNRSGQAVNIMKSIGFNEVYDLKGGWSNWPKE